MAKIDACPVDIVIPSRGRPGNVARMMQMLPTARFYVDEREADEYNAVAPPEKLVFHKPTETSVEFRRMLAADDRFGDLLCTVDDDLEAVVSVVGLHPRRITDPGSITQIIINTALIARDIGAPLFGWGSQQNSGAFLANDPIRLAGSVGGAWGHTLPVGERITPDARLSGRAAADSVLQALLKHRLVYIDSRFVWEFGPSAHTGEGATAMRKRKSMARDDDMLKSKWGRYYGGLGRKSLKQGGGEIPINVPRRSEFVSDA